MNQKLKKQVVEQVTLFIQQAREHYNFDFPEPQLKFDLTGSTAGQFCRGKQLTIRFNPDIAMKHMDEFCSRTVPHEVAHLVVDQLFPGPGTRPHGPEWQQVMLDFGADISRCHNYDLTGIPVRRQRRFSYQCACRQHAISATRHNRITRYGASYRCRYCGSPLRRDKSNLPA